MEDEIDYMDPRFVEDTIPEKKRKSNPGHSSFGVKQSRATKKKRVAEAESEHRDRGLQASLGNGNKGFLLLQQMGFCGGGLGKHGQGRSEPIGLSIPMAKAGLGLEQHVERKALQRAGEARVRADTFTEHLSSKFTLNRLRAQYREALLTVVDLSGRQGLHHPFSRHVQALEGMTGRSLRPAAGTTVNSQDGSNNSIVGRDDFGQLDVSARSKGADASRDDDDDASQSHSQRPSIDLNPQMMALTDLAEQIKSLVHFLRTHFFFCYYCGVMYGSQAELDEQCPGVSEADHE